MANTTHGVLEQWVLLIEQATSVVQRHWTTESYPTTMANMAHGAFKRWCANKSSNLHSLTSKRRCYPTTMANMAHGAFKQWCANVSSNLHSLTSKRRCYPTTVARVAHVAHEAFQRWGANRPSNIHSLVSRRHILTTTWSYNTQSVQGRVATRTSKTLCLRSR